MEFSSYMDVALAEAKAAAILGEVPVGAVIVDPATGTIVARGGNRTRTGNDPTAHAEIVAIRSACVALGHDRLPGLDLYVTLEPCAMCAGAIAHARLARLYYGASDPKSGGVAHGARVFARDQTHHVPEVYDGISEAACAAVLKRFFEEKR